MVSKKKRGVKKKELFNFHNAIILLAILILFVILKTVFIPPSGLLEEAKSDLTEEAEIVLDKLTDDSVEVALLNANELIEERIENLDSMDYEEVKNILGVDSDFCIFIEDTNGDIVEIDDTGSGIGSDKISINGNPCG
jgi:Na+/phosphate symporter